MAEKNAEKILVIKLSALGDFIQALGAMRAIREHHPAAHITLMTTKMFMPFAQRCGYFDEVWIDTKPKAFEIGAWIALRKKLRAAKFSRVYDLQNNDRTGMYFRLFSKRERPEWVGTAKGASHANTSPHRTAGHAFDGHMQTLGLAGIQNVRIDRMEWIREDLPFDIKTPYVLLVPGCSPQHPYKRWPAAHYAALANALYERGMTPVILGTLAEQEIVDEIAAQCPQAQNLAGKTNLMQIAVLARNAAGAVGNDTGPIHIIAATGCPSVCLFSGRSNPVRHAPKGENTRVLQEQNLDDLAVEDVLQGLLQMISSPARQP